MQQILLGGDHLFILGRFMGCRSRRNSQSILLIAFTDGAAA
jgi:hypothetical protein